MRISVEIQRYRFIGVDTSCCVYCSSTEWFKNQNGCTQITPRITPLIYTTPFNLPQDQDDSIHVRWVPGANHGEILDEGFRQIVARTMCKVF